jgi:hypothetical protein
MTGSPGESGLNAKTADVGSRQVTELNHTIVFGVDGNCEKFVTTGWRGPERGFRWMTGAESELRFSGWFGTGDYAMELDLIPFIIPSVLPVQRLTVSVNGTVVGQSAVAQGGRIGFVIPGAALGGRETTSIVFSHPDAARPCDFGRGKEARLLSLSLKRLTVSPIRPESSGQRIDGAGGIALSELEQRVGMTADKFMLNFESIGDNCEFGLVQRRCGAEPLSLLRFSNILLSKLLRALEAGFKDFGNADQLEFRLTGKNKAEYVIHDKRYGLSFHTFRYRGEVDEQKLIAGEPARLAFLVRKFVEDLGSESKIFVCKRNNPLLEEEILPLYIALNSFGRNTLLWLVPADAEHKTGSVEKVTAGLFKGYIERFAPLENAHDLLLDAWLEVCVNTYRLSRGEASKVAESRKPTWLEKLGHALGLKKREDVSPQ